MEHMKRNKRVVRVYTSPRSGVKFYFMKQANGKIVFTIDIKGQPLSWCKLDDQDSNSYARILLITGERK